MNYEKYITPEINHMDIERGMKVENREMKFGVGRVFSSM